MSANFRLFSELKMENHAVFLSHFIFRHTLSVSLALKNIVQTFPTVASASMCFSLRLVGNVSVERKVLMCKCDCCVFVKGRALDSMQHFLIYSIIVREYETATISGELAGKKKIAHFAF